MPSVQRSFFPIGVFQMFSSFGTIQGLSHLWLIQMYVLLGYIVPLKRRQSLVFRGVHALRQYKQISSHAFVFPQNLSKPHCSEHVLWFKPSANSEIHSLTEKKVFGKEI